MTDNPEAPASGTVPDTVAAPAAAAPAAVPRKRRQSAPKPQPAPAQAVDTPAAPLFTIRTF